MLAVDSSSINTGSAQMRSQRLEKYWPGLVRSANKAESSSISPREPPLGTLNEVCSLTEARATTNNQPRCVQVTQFVTPETNLRMLVRKHLACPKEIVDATALGGDAAGMFDFESAMKDSALVTEEAASHHHSVTVGVLSLKSVTEGVKSKDSAIEEGKSIESLTDGVKSLDSVAEDTTSHHTDSTSGRVKSLDLITDKVMLRRPNVNEGVKSLESDPKGMTSLTSVTEGMTSLLADATQMCSERVMLTGLHTCGNLAASMLDMFCADSAAGVLCNVGCCYHHLDEVFSRSPFEGDGKSERLDSQWPDRLVGF